MDDLYPNPVDEYPPMPLTPAERCWLAVIWASALTVFGLVVWGLLA